MRLALLLALVSQGFALAATAAPSVVYLSPLPGSERLRPATTLAARFDTDIAPSAVAPGLIRASGSVSGDHAGRVVLSDDRRTVVFRPDRPFAPGERVEAAVACPGSGETRTFWFSVAAEPAPPFDPMSMLERPATGALATVPDTLPDDFPQIVTTQLGPTAPGKLFLASFGLGPGQPAYLLILDNEGRPLFQRRRSAPSVDFKIQPNGQITWYDGELGKFVAADSTFAVVDSFACGNGYLTDLHELRLLPNGHALVLGTDLQVVDMSEVVPGGNPSAIVAGMILQELDVAKNVVFQWRSWDHFEITDATHEDLTHDFIDYVHTNAIEIDADGNLLISNRHMDEITKIDRVTGATIWRWGGKHDQFTHIDDPLGFCHQHAIRRLANGHYTLFDNGNFHPYHISRAVEYELDQAAHTARQVWSFMNLHDTNAFAMGYAQRLPNGNTLVGNGFGKPDAIEVAPDGTRLLELNLPDGFSSYRVYRFPWGPEPPTPTIALSGGVPNPSRGTTRLTLNLPRPTTVAVDIFNAAGRRVMSVRRPRLVPAGPLAIDVDLSSLPAGVYLCRLDAGTESHTRRLVRVR